MKQQNAKALQELFQTYLENLSYAREPMGLYKPVEYVLGIGGKRIRPTLMLLAYNLFKWFRRAALAANMRKQQIDIICLN